MCGCRRAGHGALHALLLRDAVPQPAPRAAARRAGVGALVRLPRRGGRTGAPVRSAAAQCCPCRSCPTWVTSQVCSSILLATGRQPHALFSDTASLNRVSSNARQTVDRSKAGRAGDQQAGDEEIQAAVARMRCVIELSRNVRDRHLKPLKQPLRRIIVSHVDTASLASLVRPKRGGWAPQRSGRLGAAAERLLGVVGDCPSAAADVTVRALGRPAQTCARGRRAGRGAAGVCAAGGQRARRGDLPGPAGVRVRARRAQLRGAPRAERMRTSVAQEWRMLGPAPFTLPLCVAP
jgi:hypothetical protein